MPQALDIRKLVLWAAFLPIGAGLVCVACADGGHSVLLEPTIAFVAVGVLAGAVSYEWLGRLVFAAGKTAERLQRFAKGALLLAVLAVAFLALRVILSKGLLPFVQELFSRHMMLIGAGFLTIEELLSALLTVMVFVFGACWAWVGFELLGEPEPSQDFVPHAPWVDVALDALAAIIGALMWPAWHCVLEHLGIGIVVPVVLTFGFVACVCVRALRLGACWYGREIAFAALGACLARVSAIVAPQLLSPAFGLSLSALALQTILIGIFALESFLPGKKPDEEPSDEDGSPLLSEELKSLLASYGLTEKESVAHAMKEQEASSAEIGELLGIKAPTVREYQRRARTKLGDEGQRRVREQLRKEEEAQAASSLPSAPGNNTLLGISIGLTLALLALFPLGNSSLLLSYTDRVVIIAAFGLVAAWFFLRARWLARLGRLSSRMGWALQIAAIGAVFVIFWWRLSEAAIVQGSSVLDALAAFAGFVLVFAVAIFVVDSIEERSPLVSFGLTSALLCVAFGFVFEEAWRILGNGGFGFAATTLCVLIFAGLLWLLAQAGLPAIVFATLSFFILLASALSSGFETLHIAAFLALMAAFALAAALSGNRYAVRREPFDDMRLSVWATPQAFDALLVIVCGGVAGILLTQLDSYLFGLGIQLGLGQYFCTVLACVVMLAVFGMAALIWLGFASFNARIRIAKLKASMVKDAEKMLRAGLVAEGLTERQARVAFLLAEGWTPDEIADKLAYSRGTVVRDRGALYKMLAVHTRAGLARHIEKLATELWGYEPT